MKSNNRQAMVTETCCHLVLQKRRKLKEAEAEAVKRAEEEAAAAAAAADASSSSSESSSSSSSDSDSDGASEVGGWAGGFMSAHSYQGAILQHTWMCSAAMPLSASLSRTQSTGDDLHTCLQGRQKNKGSSKRSSKDKKRKRSSKDKKRKKEKRGKKEKRAKDEGRTKLTASEDFGKFGIIREVCTVVQIVAVLSLLSGHKPVVCHNMSLDVCWQASQLQYLSDFVCARPLVAAPLD
jgi:hypothetical protein